MPVTLKDVAELAGVTPAVVSNVLNNRHNSIRVSLATAERVRNASQQLNYRVNVVARNFRARQTMTLGVLNGMGLQRPSLTKGPRYFAALMDGILDGAFAAGYSVTLCPQLLGEDPSQGLGDGRFDGLIWYSIAPTDSNRKALERCGVPTVILHASAEDFDNKHVTVGCDNAQGIGLALDYLVGAGHSRIGFAIEGDAMNVESAKRLQAFHDHARRLGLKIGKEDVLDVHRDRQAMNGYLAAVPRHTAMVVHADGLASDFIRAAPTHGVRIPDDLSVIGFDSTEFCDELRPSLTSISQPLTEMGKTAAQILVDLIAEKPSPKLDIVLPCGLDIRGSTMALTR